METTSHLRFRPVRSSAMAGFTLLFCSGILSVISSAPAAAIDQTFQYDALNRLTAAGATTYQHDAAGNLVQITATPNLFVTPSTGTVAYAANSSTTVSLTANVSWTAGSDQTWLTISPASGNTGTTLTLTATTQNPTTSTRSAIVTITGGGFTSQVTVTQEGAPPAGTLTLSPTSVTVLSGASSVYGFGVTATGSWSALSDQPWLTLTTSSGSGNGSVLFTITENTTAAIRSANVVVTSGSQTATFTLNQQGASVVDDHGDTAGAATILQTATGPTGGTLTAGDLDYFRVTVPGSGILIVWSEGQTDTHARLYDSVPTLLLANADSGLGSNFRLSAKVSMGDYYIRVQGSTTAITGAYSVNTRFIPTPSPLQITCLEREGNDVNFGFTGLQGTLCNILGSDDLKNWTLITSLTGTDAESLIKLTGQGVQPNRFFRISVTLPE